MPEPAPHFVTKSQFAAHLGVSPSYVTQLRKDGRLVLSEDGMVDLQASLARVKATEDANRDDVKKRWAQHRGEPGGGAAPEPDRETRAAGAFSAARAAKMMADAKKAQLEYQKMAGGLVELEAVQRAAAGAGATLRGALESLADRLAPELVGIQDEARVHALLTERIEEVLNNLHATFAQMATQLAGDGA